MILLLTVASVLPGVEPLPESGADHQRVLLALYALAQGDAAPLEALPPRLWDAPPAVPDSQDPELGRRWTLAVAEAQRRGHTAVLSYAQSLTTAQAWDRPWAPRAGELLRLAGWRSWDRGQREDATLLFNRSGSTTALPALEIPGATGRGRPIAGPLPNLRPGIAATRHWLLGVDPWDRVRWQRRLDEGSRTAISPGAAVILGPAGSWLVNRDGQRTPLPPAPQDAQPEAATAQGAWFSTQGGRQRWWLPAGGGPAALSTPERSLGSPLVHGTVSLWLDEIAIRHFDGAELMARVPHGIPLTFRAQLIGSLSDPWVVDGRGGSWRLDGPPIPDQVAPSDAPTPVDPRHPFDAPRPHPPVPRKAPDGRWRLGAQQWELQRSPGRLGVFSHGGDATWTTSWMALPTDEAPATTMLVRGDRIIVLEGLARFTILDRLGGRRLAAVEAPEAVPERITADLQGNVAWWHGPQLHFRSGESRSIRPGEVLGIREGFLALSPQGSLWIRPGQAAIPIAAPSWPSIPEAIPGGVAAGGAWWPWRHPTPITHTDP